jgi:hypothetical protein
MIFTSLVVGLTAAGVGAVLYTIRKDKQRNPELVQHLSKQENIGARLDSLYKLRDKQAQAKAKLNKPTRRPLKPRKKATR